MTKSRPPVRFPGWALLLLTVGVVLLLPSAAYADGTDGSGTIALTPGAVTASSTGNSLTFTYTADSVGTTLGEVEVDVPDGWSAPQTSESTAAGYVSASTGSVTASAGNDGTGGTVDVSELTLPPNGTLTITYSDAAATSTPGQSTFTSWEQATALGTLTQLTSSQPQVQVFAPDGSGTIVPAPNSVFAGSNQSFTYTYTAASGGIQDGTVELAVPSGWTPPQIGAPSSPGYVTSSLGSSDALLDAPGSVSIQPGDIVQITGVTLGAGDQLLISYANVTAPSASSYMFTTQEGSLGGDTPSALETQPQVTVNPVQPPGAPDLSSPVAGNGQVELSWSPPTDDGGGSVTDYLIDEYVGGDTSSTPKVIDTESTGTTATVSGLTNAQSYTFTVQAVNSAGDGAASGSQPATPYTVPDQPVLATPIPQDGAVQLSWSAPSDNGSALTGYVVNVYSGPGTSGTPTAIPEGPAATFAVVPNLTDGQQYTFTVVATNLAGDSGASNSEGAAPARAPAAPSLTSMLPGNQQVQLSWTPPRDDGGSAVDDYLINVYSGSGTPSKLTTIDTGSTTTSATVPSLTNGQQYTFTVQAVNSAGPGTASPAEPGTPITVPDAPSLTTPTPGNDQVRLSWSAPSQVGGSAVNDYLINVYPGSGTSGTPMVIDTGAATTSATVLYLVNGQQYTFTVQAVNGAGDGEPSNSESQIPATTPSAPSLTSVSPGDGQVRLSWSAPSNDGGADVSDYLVDVYAGSGTSGTPKVIDTGSTATSAPVAGLTDGKQYTFTVQAANRAGDGAASAAASTTPAAAPGAPDLLSTSAGDRIVEIAWSPTAAANDGGAPITGYDVFRSTTAGQQGTRLATVYSGDSYIDQTVINGTTYYYEVAAVNQAGAGAPSNQMSARPQSFVPAPTLVKTTTVEGHRVSFSAPNKCIKAGEVQGRLTVSSKSSHAKKLVFRGATFTVGTLVRKTISRSKPSSSAMHVTLHVKHMAPGGSYPFVAAPSIAIGKARVHIHRLRLTITAC